MEKLDIGLVLRPKEPLQPLRKLMEWLKARGHTVWLDGTSPELQAAFPSGELFFGIPQMGRLDFCVVLGGDGTLLGAARLLNDYETPLLAVNLGRLGFLTDTTQDELYSTLEAILVGQRVLDKRDKIRAELLRDGQRVYRWDALNDVNILKEPLARMITLRTWVNADHLTDYRADGLIVSTATGSTAYSLSAGGPILLPQMRAVVMAPICPHTLSARPLILRLPATIEVTLLTPEERTWLSVDGQQGVPLYNEDVIRITLSPRKTVLLRSHRQDYFSVLRKKLRWGEG